MRTIALVSQKGGVGKTVLASNLAVTAAEAGERVIALDLDEQGSLAEWASRRRAGAPIDVRRLVKAGTPLREILAALAAQGYTLAILDCPGKFDTANADAMRAADLSLIPTRPAAFDIHAARATVQALLGMGRRFAFVLNQCPPQPNNPRAKSAAIGLGALGALAQPFIGQRAAYQDGAALGMSAAEAAPGDRAGEEIRRLWAWIVDELSTEKAA